jgi:hypothetical protein
MFTSITAQLDATSQTVHPLEKIPRDPVLATEKAIAEGTPAEVQNILGWKFNTFGLIICLPDNKH